MKALRTCFSCGNENEILNIGHSNAILMMTSEEDKIFSYKESAEGPKREQCEICRQEDGSNRA